MKSPLRLLLVLAGIVALHVGFAVTIANAQNFAPAPIALAADDGLNAALATPAPAVSPAPALTPAQADTLTSLLTAHPRLAAALSIYATLAGLYQLLIAFAHKRAAETTSVTDDQWLASLEAKTWFRVLDRIFYWGGYLGSWSGGRKL